MSDALPLPFIANLPPKTPFEILFSLLLDALSMTAAPLMPPFSSRSDAAETPSEIPFVLNNPPSDQRRCLVVSDGEAKGA
jgi:hypothetical protein